MSIAIDPGVQTLLTGAAITLAGQLFHVIATGSWRNVIKAAVPVVEKQAVTIGKDVLKSALSEVLAEINAGASIKTAAKEVETVSFRTAASDLQAAAPAVLSAATAAIEGGVTAAAA
jgi:hypothetical protein